ncbi:hypothetical protein ACTI_37950 [Actinoplanes sp. OR16]|uniref:hypothetical protein n=1 Tax=Actinoplanes sp. OR16 TaxID=946334 RepID=UPI000F6C0700|nr:hypothetical protein [Actinoplanes sp. OR16]BBH67110.1 hypothetical protein ACTI_37950 [Actinoplanes sp. OR16]
MSHFLLTCYTAVAARWGALTDPAERERGDSPVSTAIIVALVAAAALAVATLIATIANNWAARIPQ